MASIAQNVSGKWRARVRRAGYQTISKTFPTKVAALDWVRQMETKQDTGVTFSTKEAKAKRVSELFIRYRDEVSSTKKSSRSEKNAINRLLRADFMNRRIHQINQNDINEWKRQRLTEIKPESVGREMTTISTVFTYAMREWQMPYLQNPVKLCARPSNSGKFRSRRWTDEYIELFLQAADFDETKLPETAKDHLPWVFLVAIETAMRTGELAKIRVKDFFPEERYVFIGDTKNADDRQVPLSSKALKYLTFICQKKKPNDRIFMMDAGTIGVYFREVRKAAGLDDFDLRFHDTRHEGTTRLSEKLPNVLELGAVTGHRSFRCLQRYYNPKASELARKLG